MNQEIEGSQLLTIATISTPNKNGAPQLKLVLNKSAGRGYLWSSMLQQKQGIISTEARSECTLETVYSNQRSGARTNEE